jgi:hypothetical protein
MRGSTLRFEDLRFAPKGNVKIGNLGNIGEIQKALFGFVFALSVETISFAIPYFIMIYIHFWLFENWVRLTYFCSV